MLRSKAGRFHEDPAAEPTTYVEESIETAWSEIQTYFGEHANPHAFRLWEITIPTDVRNRLSDLTQKEERKSKGIDEETLKSIPASRSLRELASNLRREGMAGVIYPSVRNVPAGICAAVFLEGGIEDALEVRPLDEEWRRFISDRSRS